MVTERTEELLLHLDNIERTATWLASEIIALRARAETAERERDVLRAALVAIRREHSPADMDRIAEEALASLVART